MKENFEQFNATQETDTEDYIEVVALNELERLKDERIRTYKRNNPEEKRLSEEMRIALFQDVQSDLLKRKEAGDEYEREGLLDELLRQIQSSIDTRKDQNWFNTYDRRSTPRN